MSAAINIERFPDWSSRPRAAEPKIQWLALGSEYDIAHISRLWQRVMRFNLHELPDDESIMWQLADRLGGRRSDIVRIQDAVVSIDRRHMGDFRDGVDWLWDHLCDEHADERHVNIGTEEDPVWVRKEDELPPIINLEDAQRAIDIIDVLRELAADNVVKLWDEA